MEATSLVASMVRAASGGSIALTSEDCIMEDGSAVISTEVVQAATAVISTGVAVRRRSGEISFATASETRRARVSRLRSK